MVTEKNKEQFRTWYELKGYHVMFDQLPFEMQIGVYLAYYDSIDLIIFADYCRLRETYSFTINGKSLNDKWYKSRNEAYKAAFKKIDELINQNKDE